MKKPLIYLLLLLLTGAVIVLFFTGSNTGSRKFDGRITLRRQDKVPYGSWVAFNELNQVFPEARVLVNRKEPGYWDSVSKYDDKQLYVCITDRFTPDETEMHRLVEFAQNGNDVFIVARYISATADAAFHCGSSIPAWLPESTADDHKTRFILKTPPFGDTVYFQYPGIGLNSYFSRLDEKITQVLGVNKDDDPVFIRLRAGKGNFFVHLEPLAFSNYFLLHGNNIGYYEKIFSLVKPGIQTVIWDEYYLNKQNEDQPGKNKGWMSTLMEMQNDEGKFPFRSAFWVLILLGIVYVLMEMRRRQRLIPVIRKPSNESLDFVKTIGRLYFQKGDHRNLCRKMAAYFLEHVRTRYKLSTGLLNEEFIQLLHYKSGAGEKEISDIVYFIKNMDQGALVSQQHLVKFHQLLESFYKKT